MPSDEEKNVFLESLKKEQDQNIEKNDSFSEEIESDKKKKMSGTALFATLFLLFLLVLTLLIFIISVGGAQNPILQSFGIESGEVKQFLKTLVNGTFGTLVIVLLLLFSLGLFRGISAKKEEKEKRRGSLIFGFVSGGLIFAVVLAWLGMFAFVNSLPATAMNLKNKIEVLGIEPEEKIVAPLTMSFSAQGIKEALEQQGETIVGFFWDKDGDGNFEIHSGRDPRVDLWITEKKLHTIALQVKLQENDPQYFNVEFEVDDVVFGAMPNSGEIPLQVQFDASEVTDGYGVRTFEWDFDGDGIFEKSSSNPKMEYVFERIGVFPVKLRVLLQDERVLNFQREIRTSGATSERIKAVIEASPQEGIAPLRVSFSAKNSFSTEGQIVSYVWNFQEENTTLRGETLTKTFNIPGTYTVALTVEDTLGIQHTVQQEVVVRPQENAPKAQITTIPAANAEQNILAAQAPQKVVFDATASTDIDNDIVAYQWDLDGDTLADEFGEQITHTFTAGGTYQVTLIVTDATGNSSSATVRVVLPKDEGAARILATPETGEAPLTIQFDGSESTCGENCYILSYEWDFGDGTRAQITGAHTTHTFTTVGTFSVQLKVTTNVGETLTTKKIVAVRVPSLKACFTPSRTRGKAPLRVSFSPNCSTGIAKSWKWDFGDGALATEREPDHLFTAPGTYTVILALTDENGTNSQVSQIITVE